METGLYYYGARYLDAKTSRWLSTDPALGEYIPIAPVDDKAKKHNENLPGMGGVFSTVNLHLYHYAGNNPVRYTDPDGRQIMIPKQADRAAILRMINSISKDKFRIDDNGYLVRDGNKKNGFLGSGLSRSQEYSNRLQDGIDAEGTIYIGIEQEIQVPVPENFRGIFPDAVTMDFDIDKYGGGGVAVSYDNGSIIVGITGNRSPDIPMIDGTTERYSPARILMHEIVVHGVPGIVTPDKIVPGNGIDKENRVNSEMSWKLRAYDLEH